MLVKLQCYTNQIEAFEEYYNSMGLTLVDKLFEDSEIVTLTFKGDRVTTVAQVAYNDPGAKAYLEFSDGSLSPLYVRRQNWLDD